MIFLKKEKEILLINLLQYSAHTVESANVKQCVHIRIYIFKFNLVSVSSLVSLISKNIHI